MCRGAPELSHEIMHFMGTGWVVPILHLPGPGLQAPGAGHLFRPSLVLVAFFCTRPT